MRTSLKPRASGGRQEDNNSGRDYTVHDWNWRERLLESGKAAGLVLLFAWFFYRSVWALLPLSILGILFFRKREKEKIAEDKRQLALQFKECILSASASLKSGYSVENAFVGCLPDMKMMFGSFAFICVELERIQKGLVMNRTLEDMLGSLGRRSGIQEIVEFSEVFAIAKRSGGSIPEIISASAGLIGRRIEALEDIRTQTAARRMEQKVMNIMPFGILLYVEATNKGYFDALYHNVTGIAVMTVCLAVYLGAYVLAEKILEGSASVW